MPNYIDMSMTGVIHEYEIFGGRPPESKNDERSESENDCSRSGSSEQGT